MRHNYSDNINPQQSINAFKFTIARLNFLSSINFFAPLARDVAVYRPSCMPNCSSLLALGRNVTEVEPFQFP